MLRHRFAVPSVALIVGAVAISTLLPALSSQMAPEPTENHLLLLGDVGEWEGTLTSFMPEAPEAIIPSTQVVRAIGLWTQTTFECDYMGMPYVGTGCTGYDTAQKKFVGTWIDNMGTHLAVMEGQIDPKTKVITMRWKAPDPMTGDLVQHRSDTVRTKDSYTSTFYMGEGKGTKSMVIAMKRKAMKQEEKSGAQ